MVCRRLHQENGGGVFAESQQSKNVLTKILAVFPVFPPSPFTLRLFFSIFSLLLRQSDRQCPFLLAAGWRLPHPTQLEPEPPAAVHSGRALPAEGLQHSHPLPGGGAGLRPWKRGQKE